MKYRAVLHNANNGSTKVESIWFDTESEAIKTGESGLNFYGGSHYAIETTEGMEKAFAGCEDCSYETELMPMKDLIYKISMEGGYISSDKEGGYFSKCPQCESEGLSLHTN